ncbi:nucleoside phosphorylase [Sunxiuqinia sp. A32]|uniref:nucleoside phosphorylase n=1 Tax=Sunxiuqinia sp. A32 TaxID=3461496 RepID=UPI004045F3A9
MIRPSELIINPDGSIFHLHLKPNNIADNVILVGDPARVDLVSSYFTKITHESANREFVSKTGLYNNQPITVLSTGIGTDNIDIVLTELDALVNIDFETREVKSEKRSLNIIRIGTSGGLQKNLPVNSFVISEKAIGFDGLLNFYANRNKIVDLEFEEEFKFKMNWNPLLASPYVINCSSKLLAKIKDERFTSGVTISAPGFYGPQGRVVRLDIIDPELNDKIESFKHKNYRITNYEMECSAVYGLSALLGHHALTACLIIANRVNKQANGDYKLFMEELIIHVLKKLTE